MTGIDTYKHLDEDSKLRVEVSMTQLAEQICALNYGAHRLLSALVHELRRRNLATVAAWEARENDKPVDRRRIYTDEDRRSPLADAIEEALNKDGFY